MLSPPALCDLRCGHPVEGGEWPGVEPVSSGRSSDQGDRGPRVLPLPVHHGGNRAGAHRVRQEHPRVRGPLPKRPGESLTAGHRRMTRAHPPPPLQDTNGHACLLSLGDFTQVRRARGYFCYAAFPHEQRRAAGGQRQRLCDQGVPAKFEEALQRDHGAQV